MNSEDIQTDEIVHFTPASWTSDPPQPDPATQEIPPWFQNLSRDADGIPSLKHSTVKLCMPFNDALGMGWILRSPVAFKATKNDDSVTISVTSDQERTSEPVTPLSPTQPEYDTVNSTFKTPDALLRTGWNIETPPGASMLVAPPLNRRPGPVTPVSMFAETDSYTGELSLPIVLNGDEITVEKGDPLAQLIPLRRRTLLDSPALRGFGSESTIAEMEGRIQRATQARSGVYREDIWVNKPSAVTLTDPEELPITTQDQDETVDPKPEPERALLGSETEQAYYCREEYFGHIPEPVSAGEHIPADYRDELKRTGEIDSTQPTTDWILAAMDLGQIIPLPVTIELRRGENGELDARGHGSDRHYHILDPRKLGDGHPLAPLRPVNMITHWRSVVPRGYSNLYIQPLNHFQQVYQAFSGIVESDRYLSTANIPGRINRSYKEARLPAGMPVTQAIPLHRDSLIHTAYIDNDE